MSKEWMSPRERFLAGLRGGSADRVTVGNPTSLASQQLLRKVGVNFPDAHLEPEKIAQLAAGGYEILQFDTILPYFSVVIEAAALGCQVNWGDNESLPECVTHPFGLDDLVIPTRKEFLQSEVVAALLEAIVVLKKKYPRVAILGKAMGPWALAYHMFGVQEFLMQTILNPDKVKACLRKLKEVTVMSAEAQIKAGADALCIVDQAAREMVSRDGYVNLLWPLHRELSTLDIPLIMHMCGDVTDRLPDVKETGFMAYHYDTKMDVSVVKEKLGNRVCLVGGVATKTLHSGSVDDVKTECENAVRAGVSVLAPECGISLLTPLENLEAMVKASRAISV